MVDISSQEKKINIKIQSGGVQANVGVTQDTAQYYSEKAREWAISNRIVDGVDYSSKYYANKSNQSALNAQSFAQSAQDSYNNFQDSVDSVLSNIDSSVQGGIDEINNTKTDIIADIEFVADGEKQEINELADVIKDNAEDIINRVGLNMFDTILKDHILTYEESKGLALQGTYVYKEAVAGSRYGYPDFYAKCLEEMEAGVDETITKGGITKTIRKNPNGHRFYDIADKDLADAFLADVGACWWYGVDAENERILLPRNEWFEQATSNVNKVNNHSKAGLPNVTGTFNIDVNSNEYYSSTTWTGAFSGEQAGTQGASGDGVTSTKITFDASKSNSIYGRSTTVQPTAVKKLLYICVGNTTNYEGVTEVVNQGMELLEQVNQGVESRLDVNITNITTEGKKTIIAWGLPDYSNGIEVRFTSGGLNYTVPDNGFLTVQMLLVTNALGEIKVNGITVLRGKSGSSSYFGQLNGQIMVRKGDVITSVNAYAPTDTGVNFAIFYPLKGAN